MTYEHFISELRRLVETAQGLRDRNVGQYLEQIAAQWDVALERLRAAVESAEVQ